MQSTHVKLGQNGRVVIPAEYRKALQLREGEEVVLTLEEGSIRVMSVRAALEQARRLFSPMRKPDGSAVDELLADRRAEAERESRK